jgi:hypothetical protein
MLKSSMPGRIGAVQLRNALLGLAVAALAAAPGSASAQQNPFIGTWGTSLTVYGGGFAAFWDLYPDGTMHLSGVVTNGGQVLHEWGTYQLDAAHATISYVFTRYEPRLCSMGVCEPGPPNINQPATSSYRFANPDQFIMSDGTVYTRQPTNPFPAPHR